MKDIVSTFAGKLQKMLAYSMRDRIILSYLNYPVRRNRINMHWFAIGEKKLGGLECRKKTDVQNFGDYLANPIWDYMMQYYHLDPDYVSDKTYHVYTVGSIIMLGYQDACIWGSGLLRSEPEKSQWGRNKYRKLDVRCVRGPETMRRLKENGYDVSKCVFGDPGLLMPLIYQPKEGEKADYVVVRHMSQSTADKNQVDIMTDDWKSVIDQIYNSRLVISSSLHGIIIAEAYGIPAILLGPVQFNDYFKYNDYYYSTGRTEYPVCTSVEEALKMPLPKVPDVSGLQKNLLDSFPTDLWKRK